MRIKNLNKVFVMCFIVVAMFSVYFFSTNPDKIKDYVPLFFSTSFAASCGSYFAFMLNRSDKEQEQSQFKKASVNRALFILIQQINAITLLISRLEEKEKNNHEILKNIEIKEGDFSFPLKVANYDNLRQEIKDLDFLLDSYYSKTLLDLMNSDFAFHLQLESIERISNMFKNEIAKFYTDEIGMFSDIICKKQYLISLEHIVLNDLKKCIESLYLVHDELFKIGKELFPREKFVHVKRKSQDED